MLWSHSPPLDEMDVRNAQSTTDGVCFIFTVSLGWLCSLPLLFLAAGSKNIPPSHSLSFN
jgi:hypothetical protein